MLAQCSANCARQQSPVVHATPCSSASSVSSTSSVGSTGSAGSAASASDGGAGGKSVSLLDGDDGSKCGFTPLAPAALSRPVFVTAHFEWSDPDGGVRSLLNAFAPCNGVGSDRSVQAAGGCGLCLPPCVRVVVLRHAVFACRGRV